MQSRKSKNVNYILQTTILKRCDNRNV